MMTPFTSNSWPSPKRQVENISLNYDRLAADPVLKRQQEFEERMHVYDVLIVIGLVTAAMGLPTVFFMLYFLKA
ncbi:hypothetical protein [Caballeronia sp. GAFFF2]|uniref:hypothetical protein n=1 Tax=Caballeronia sp. GAFFF2 TaxID=2921741 RepID=UPI002028784B|nr:hypothetical protein [Caballeronia sp. GAFFF2]